MSYQVSARKYRPQTFEEVVGQPHIVRTLSNAIEAGRIAHAYLFSGVRGVGKTTIARVFAKALNCETGPTLHPCNQCEACVQVTQGNAADVLEIDGASNNGVDAVRDLTDNIRYRPLSCRYKIYIIDEVHMLSTAAFNALLKTLEEPPDHAVFMFATTETHKIPRTILSRCQHHAFRRIAREEIAAHLSGVAEQDSITASRTAIATLSRAADGSMRDALSLFDQAVSFGGGQVSQDDLTLMLGMAGQDTLNGFAGDLLSGDASTALERLSESVNRGQDLQILMAELVEHFRNLLVCKVSHEPGGLIDLSDDDVAELVGHAAQIEQAVLEQVLNLLSDAQERCRRALNPRFVIEAALVRAAQAHQLTDIADLIERLDALSAGAPMPRRAPQQPKPSVAAAPVSPPKSAPRQTPPQQPAQQPARQAPQQATLATPDVRLPAAHHSSPETAGKRHHHPPHNDPPHHAPALTHEAAKQTEPAQPAQPAATTAPQPASAPSSPAAPAASPALSSNPREQWVGILQEIKKRRPALASYLEQGALKIADGNRVEIAFPPAYEVMHGMVSRPDNQQFITQLARDLTGRPIAVSFSIGNHVKEEAPVTLAEEYEADQQAQFRQEVDHAMKEPFLKELVDRFDGEIVELRKPEK